MYGKIFASLYQGTLRGRAHEILVFTNMIACCDQYGVVDKHPKAIAEETGLTIDEARRAIENLELPDPESRSADHGGARIVRHFDNRNWGWLIVNYAKYRAMRNEEDRREQNRIAQERWRNRNKPASAGVSHSKPASAEVSHGKPKEKQKQKEKNTEAVVAAHTVHQQDQPPPPLDFTQWRIQVGKHIFIGEGEHDAWEAIFKIEGAQAMTDAYRYLRKKNKGGKVFLSQIQEMR